MQKFELWSIFLLVYNNEVLSLVANKNHLNVANTYRHYEKV
jgi:hypothetical protein